MDARALHSEIDSCMRADQHRLRNRLKRLKSAKTDNNAAAKESEALLKLKTEVEASVARLS